MYDTLKNIRKKIYLKKIDGGNKVFTYSEIKSPYFIYLYFCI